MIQRYLIMGQMCSFLALWTLLNLNYVLNVKKVLFLFLLVKGKTKFTVMHNLGI